MTKQLEDIGTMVYTERMRRRASAEAMSKLAGVHHNTWFRVERGEGVTTHSFAAVLATVGLSLTVQS
jgi:hypothetical protein